nr:MAG TPA: hypothetical protein [Caudoviricetes sp.]
MKKGRFLLRPIYFLLNIASYVNYFNYFNRLT